MKSLDLRKQFKSLYQPSAKAPELVDVLDLSFLEVDRPTHGADVQERGHAFLCRPRGCLA